MITTIVTLKIFTNTEAQFEEKVRPLLAEINSGQVARDMVKERGVAQGMAVKVSYTTDYKKEITEEHREPPSYQQRRHLARVLHPTEPIEFPPPQPSHIL